jgi:predicted dehydrogenase
MNDWRIGIVGLGFAGRTHLAALQSVGVDCIFAADRNSRNRTWAEQERGITCYTNYADLLANEALDGLIVATPPSSHADIVDAAVRRQVHVLCEKPMAVKLSDCDRIVSVATSSRKITTVGFCHRFEPAVRRLHELIQDGQLGELVLFRCTFAHDLEEGVRSWLFDPATSGGGVLVDSGTHAIDLFRYLIGEVDDAACLTSRTRSSIALQQKVEDSAVLSLRSGQCVGSIALCWRAAPWEGTVEAVGLDARAVVHYGGSEGASLHLRRGATNWEDVPLTLTDRFHLQIEHWLACLAGQQMPLVSVHDGFEATRVLLQAYGGRTET